MRIFWEKTVKIISASGAPLPNPRLPPAAGDSDTDPRVVTPAYYYNFVGFVSSAKCILFSSKKKQVTTANILPLLLPHFAPIFSFKLCKFCWRGYKNISCPRAQGTLATPLLWSAIKRDHTQLKRGLRQLN